MDFKKRLLNYVNGDATLDERIYATVLSVGVIASLISFAMTLILHMDTIARASTLACAVWLAALQVIGYRRPDKQYLCRVGLVCGLNFLIFPFGFFSGGGTDSGMILLYLLGTFNIVSLLRKPLRTILFCVQLLWGQLTLILGRYAPVFLPNLTGEQQYVIARMFLFISCATLGLMTIQIFNAYEHERERSRALTEQLEILSIRDPLTGLYNRRELFRRLEIIYLPDDKRTARDEGLRREDFYVAMFDVDNFKHLNDTYGHHFGDTVLAEVAHRFKNEMDSARGELAARYGGEEFVCVLRASGMEEAFSRIDGVRREISELAWSDAGLLRVTVSGGLVACVRYPEPDHAMHDVDALLYQAKHDGKNRVETQLHTKYPDKRT